MPTIQIGGKGVELVPRQPALLPGAPVTVAGTKLTMPAPLYARQLETVELQEAYEAGTVSHRDVAKQELLVLVETLRRNYPKLPDTWVREWDTHDIWRLRTAMIEANHPPAEESSGEPQSR